MDSRLRGKLFLAFLLFLVAIPILNLLGQLVDINDPKNKESIEYVFQSDILLTLGQNTVLLVLLTTVLAGIIGLVQATIVKLTDFRWSKWLSVGFILPLMYPLYVLAFIYDGGFSYSSSLMTFLRNNMSEGLFTSFNTGSVGFVAFVFALGLSPYFFVFFMSAIDQVNPRWVFAARSLGHTPGSTYFRLILPFIKPWLYAASIFVSVEVLSDFGGVSVFGYQTFTLAVYESWLSLFSLEIAALLSLVPLTIGIVMFFLIQKAKVQSSYSRFDRDPIVLFRLSSKAQGLTFLFLFIYFSCVFLFPMLQLFQWFLQSHLSQSIYGSLELLATTLGLGLLAALLLVSGSVFLIYYYRFHMSQTQKKWTPLVNIGYALPGTIVAIGILYATRWVGVSVSGGFALACLLLGYFVRFFAVSFQMLEKSSQRMSPTLDWAGRSLGEKPWPLFTKVHFKLLRGPVLAASILVVVEVIKELPLTLILRPFGVNTLATRLFQFTAEGQWEEAAFPAMLIIALGALSLFIGYLGFGSGDESA